MSEYKNYLEQREAEEADLDRAEFDEWLDSKDDPFGEADECGPSQPGKIKE